MSHHFDTKLAKEDPSLNVCDLYLFPGAPGSTVMAMTVNPDVGLSTPDLLHLEGLYAFRFDLNGDATEDVVFKFRFGQPRHINGDEHVHVQDVQVRRSTGDAIGGDQGELLIEGETGQVLENGGIRAFVGTVPDLFAGDGFALHTFLDSFHKEQRFNPDAFLHRQNFFAGRNITAIVLEVPDDLIGAGKVQAWATASLYGHAPEMQVSRWGLPHITNLFLTEPGHPELKDDFNKALPSADQSSFGGHIKDFVRNLTTYADSATSPEAYAAEVTARLCPAVLPFRLGTPAAFQVSGFNGRPLADDVMDVMLTLAANTPLHDGVAPDKSRMRDGFPYFGEPYSAEEQKAIKPAPRPVKQ